MKSRVWSDVLDVDAGGVVDAEGDLDALGQAVGLHVLLGGAPLVDPLDASLVPVLDVEALDVLAEDVGGEYSSGARGVSPEAGASRR
jgi:hypothetical protein